MERQTTTIDLRGSDASSAAAGFGVLADPTGRRGRRLRRAGHVVAGLFALWLAALVLAGLGLLPAAGVPLASRTGPRTEPPPLDARSPLVSANGSKPAPAARRAAPIATARRSAPTPPAHAPARRREPARRPSVAPLRRKTTVVAPPAATRPAGTPAPRPRPVATPAPHRPATAPAHRVPSRGQSGTAPGRTRPAKQPAPAPTAAPGKSGTAPGRSR